MVVSNQIDGSLPGQVSGVSEGSESGSVSHLLNYLIWELVSASSKDQQSMEALCPIYCFHSNPKFPTSCNFARSMEHSHLNSYDWCATPAVCSIFPDPSVFFHPNYYQLHSIPSEKSTYWNRKEVPHRAYCLKDPEPLDALYPHKCKQESAPQFIRC